MARYNSTQIKPAAANAEENKPSVLATSTDSMSMSLKFGLSSGDTRTFTFKYLAEDLTDEEVTEACEKIIDNGTAWEDAPIKMISAIATQTQKTTYFKYE